MVKKKKKSTEMALSSSEDSNDAPELPTAPAVNGDTDTVLTTTTPDGNLHQAEGVATTSGGEDGHTGFQFIEAPQIEFINAGEDILTLPLHPDSATFGIQKLMLEKLEGMERTLKEIRADVALIKMTSNEDATITGLPKVPASSMEQLDDCEKFVSSSVANQLALASKAAQQGGKDLKSAVENVLSALISDNVAIRFNWAGIKRGEDPKLGIKDYRLIQVVFDAVRKMPRHSSAQNSDMEEFIKVWLKNTKQRMQKVPISGQD